MKKEKVINLRFVKIPALAVSIICLLCSPSRSDSNSEGKIESTRLALEKYIENQRIISKEKRDLKLARQMLNERIELVEREIESLKDKISDAEKSIAQADKKRAGMIAENDKLKKASDSLTDILAVLEGRTKNLLKRLPDPISNRVKPLSQRLADKSGNSKLSIAERFQNIVGILNEVDKFNREISVASEVRKLDDGSSVEVTALYIGIGQAYYTNANGNVAGIATATEEGLKWKQINEASQQIAEAIAILNNEKVASFVKLPVEVK